MTHGDWVATTNGRIRLREEGIVEYRPQAKAEDTIETARENMAVFRRLLGDKAPGPHLIFLDGLLSQTREARQYLSQSVESRETCNPVALVVGSRLSRVLGNVFVGLSKSQVPLKLFSSEAEALHWLRNFAS